MGVGKFGGARVNFPDGGVGALALSKELFAYEGTTEALISNPGDAKLLCIRVESGDLRVRPGDYTVLTFDSTADVDATAETAVIDGIEARMSFIVDRGNSLSHTVGGGSPELDARLIYGPVQLSTGDLLPVGLVVDQDYWIAKPSDVGVATDEVAFYDTFAEAQAAADLPANDDRIGLTAAVGTTNVAGMANNGLNAPPAASSTDGYESHELAVGVHHISAPSELSIIGDSAVVATYWWQH